MKFRRRLKHFYRDTNGWSLVTIILALVITVPLWIIALHLGDGVGDMWQHITRYFLFSYLLNSAVLLLGTGLLSILLGLGAAWIVTQYDFPGRSLSTWLLFLPLAIPSYIVAYTYVGTLGNGGTLVHWWQALGLPLRRIEMMNIWGLIWVLSISLYPYVYAATRAIFLHYPTALRENVLLLGGNEANYRWKIAFPLATPAIIGGVFLVYMEVFNDYGAAKYYGINTFTTGIFRTWTALEDLQSAVYLCAVLLLVVLGLLGLVRWWQGRRSYAVKLAAADTAQQQRISLHGWSAAGALAWVSIPVIGGLVLPIGQLLYWASLTYATQWNTTLIRTAGHSCLLALTAAAVTVLVALILHFSSRWNNWSPLSTTTKIATIGYVLPGAIIGISIIRSNQGIIDFFTRYFNWSVGYLFYGSGVVLLYAYVFRFLAVAYQPLAAKLYQQGHRLSEAAELLRANKWRSLWRVELPLLRPALFSTFLLVFVDVMKELPLTLILKPYHVHTLAVTTYAYA
ncbi:MAG: iron ABC transporter permease, partial [Bacteroidota bacterium]